MTDNEIVKALECCAELKPNPCSQCPYFHTKPCLQLKRDALDLINRQKEYIKKCDNLERIADKTIETQKAEIERLKEEVSKARRKTLLEASSKFAGHSNYHGDTILCKLICMAEGKEVKQAKPIDMQVEVSKKLEAEIKSEAYKEFAEKLYEELRMYGIKDKFNKAVFLNVVDNAKKELVGDDK